MLPQSFIQAVRLINYHIVFLKDFLIQFNNLIEFPINCLFDLWYSQNKLNKYFPCITIFCSLLPVSFLSINGLAIKEPDFLEKSSPYSTYYFPRVLQILLKLWSLRFAKVSNNSSAACELNLLILF